MSRNGAFVVESRYDDGERIWDWRENAVVGRVLADRSNQVVADSGKLFLTASGGGKLVALRFPGGPEDTLHRRLEVPVGHVLATTVSGDVVVFTDDKSGIFAWTPGRQPEVRKLVDNSAEVHGRVEISANGRVLVVADDKKITVFGSPDLASRWTLELPLLIIEAPHVGPIRERWIKVPPANSSEALVEDSDIQERVPLNDIRCIRETPIAWKPGNFVRTVHMRGAGLPEFPAGGDATSTIPTVDALALSPSGDRLALAWGDLVWVYDVKSRRRVARFSMGYAQGNFLGLESLREYAAHVDNLMFDEDGTRLNILTDKTALWSWAEPEAEPRSVAQFVWNYPMRGQASFFLSVAQGKTMFHGDGKDMLTISVEGNLAAISSNDAYLAITDSVASSGNDSNSWARLRIVDVSRNKVVSEFRSEGKFVSIVFSPDAHAVGASGADNGVRVWDIQTGKEMARIPAQKRALAGIGFIGSDTFFTATLGSSIMNLHPIGSDKLIAEICRRSVRNLREDEWLQYLGDKGHPPACPNLH